MTIPCAPLNLDDLERVLVEDFAEARTLPADAYLSEEVLRWERHHIFDASWVCAGRAGMLPEPGCQKGIRIGGQGIVLVRQEDGEVRGFYNSCRHRGHELLAEGECRRRGTIACPYHSWAYNLDGSLRQATRFTETVGFKFADFPLIPVSVEEWKGWLFVNASGLARDLDVWLGNLDERLRDWSPGDLSTEASHDYIVEANWKLIIENYLECYHCPSIHPELCRVSPPDSAQAIEHTGMWIGGPMELRDDAETMSLDGESHGSRIRTLGADQTRQVYYFALFPNLLVSPHPDYVMTHRLDPLSPTQTRVECSWLFPQEAREVPGFDASYAESFWDITNRQDFSACEAVQRGVASHGFVPGPFDARETAVHAVQATIARAYIDGTIELPRPVDMAART